MTPPMEPLAETVIEDDRWAAPDLPALAERACRAAFAALDLVPDGFSICVMGCDDARIATLNAGFRGRPRPTNVLSWPSRTLERPAPGADPRRPEPGHREDPEHVGDIALAWETCEREADEQKKTFQDHVLHLIVHGTLHCLGYDHENDADAMRMEALEVHALATLGVENPY
jgi:probable rRNA maturation factor